VNVCGGQRSDSAEFGGMPPNGPPFLGSDQLPGPLQVLVGTDGGADDLVGGVLAVLDR
jgi:hypothetical protein